MNQIQYRRHLPELMKYLGLPMIAAELGVAEAYFSDELLTNGIERLYSIDVWNCIQGQRGDGGSEKSWHLKNFEAAKERLKKHGDKSVILRGFTNEMAWMIPDNTCGLIYVDCDHSYEAVKQDIRNYWGKLVMGGIMAFHDFESEAANYGVKQAVYEWAGEHDLAVYLISEDKSEDAGAMFFKP